MATTAYTGILHTNTEKYYNTGLNSFGQKNSSMQQAEINALLAKEQSFYNSIFPGVNDITSFISELRKLFSDIEADKQVLKKFQRDNLIKYLKSFTKSDYFKNVAEEDLYLTFRVESTSAQIDLSTIFSSFGGDVSFNQGEFKLALGADQNTIKKTMMSFLGDDAKTQAQLQKLFKAKKRRVKKNDQTRYYNAWPELTSLFAEKLSVQPSLIQVAPSLAVRSYYENSRHIKNSLYAGTAADIYFAEDNPDSNIAQELTEIRKKLKIQIRDYIGLDSGAVSQEMRMAFENVWNRTMEGSLASAAFFEKGGTFTYLTGAFGEFQTSLMYEYINLRLGRGKMPSGFSALISNTLKASQDKVDVTFKTALESFGVQVKNYGANSSHSSFDIKTTPLRLTEYSSFSKLGGNTTDFLTFVANYYFNNTYRANHAGGYDEIIAVLPTLFAEIANLGTEDLNDRVSFYQIGGNFFIPASAILSAYYSNDSATALQTGSFSMSGPNGKGSDESFHTERWAQDSSLPAAAEYFEFHGTGNFIARKTNEALYSSLVSQKISIRGSFNYKSIPNLSSYSLF